MFKKIICSLVAILLIVNCYPLHLCASATKKSIVDELYSKNPSLMDNGMIKYLEDNSMLITYCEMIQETYENEKRDDLIEKERLISSWGLSLETNISELRDIAQNYFVENKMDVSVYDDSFEKYINCFFRGDDYPVEQLAIEDRNFGPVYLYMCIIYDKTETTNPIMNYCDKSTLKEIFEEDFLIDFYETRAVELLHDFCNKHKTIAKSASSVDGARVQEYAVKYAKSYNANYIAQKNDCTNFVSQALFYGGLSKLFYASDKKADGFVDTIERWFYFNNSTSSGYSASTSWVRVVDLYKYLTNERLMAVLATSDRDKMNRYINIGFVMQGKRLVGRYTHSIIITNNEGEWCYCGHTTNRKNQNLDTFYDTYYKYRVIQVY